FDPVPIGSKKPAPVVLMLHSPEQEVLVKACEAMYKFAEKGDENKATLVELGAVEPLSKLISNEGKAVCINAVMALGVMASHSKHKLRTLRKKKNSGRLSTKAQNDVKKLLKKLDVIPFILARLAPAEDTLIHEFAGLCLAYLSVEYTSKVQISELDGLDTLIRLLSSPDPDVKKNSLECIYQLVQDFPSRAAIRELNGIPPLLELLKSEYPVIQQLALKTLATITHDAETRVALRENQGFEQLIEILGNNELNDLHVETLVVVSNCMEDMDTVQLIQQTGGLDKLLQLAETSTLPEVQMNAAKAITNTAQSTGIQPVVQLLNSENAEVKKAAALALSNLTNANHLNAKYHKMIIFEELYKQKVNQHRPVVFLDAKPPEPKGKSKGKKEEEKTKEEEEIKIPQEVIVEKKQWLLPYDPIFHSLITNVTKSVLPLPNTKEQVVALAVRWQTEVPCKPAEEMEECDWLIDMLIITTEETRAHLPL
ncbi:UNVERIFIED_CONTAM: hypothetical protein FKN15_076251, partial [Acipenser sinensis]